MRLILRKILESVFVIWAVLTIAFFGLRLGRMDPVAGLLAQGSLTADQAQSLRHSLALDEPLAVQYVDMLTGIARGQWGRSIFSAEDVASMIGGALAYTAPLALTAWLAAVALGIWMGALASHRGEEGAAGRWGEVVSPLLSSGAALPVALTGLVVLWMAVPVMAVLPDGGGREAVRFAGAVLVLAVNIGCAIGRVAETSIRTARAEPYYMMMRAQGFGLGWRLDMRLLRTCVVPVLSLAAMEAGFLIGGTMVVETVFARPGLGRMAVDAILRGDFPVVQAALLLGALGYCLCAVFAEGLAVWLDPRLRSEK